jgi:hypothetical protein
MLRRMGLDDGQIEAVEQLTRAIVNKILHAPLARLRAETDREEGLAMLEAARALFALEDPKAPGADVDEELGFSPPSGSPSAKEQAPSARQQEPSVETEPSTESESSESLEDGE